MNPLNGNRWQQERERHWNAESYMANKLDGAVSVLGGAVVEKDLFYSDLLSSPLSLYPLSQSVRPQHLSPAAFLRPVNRNHFAADRLMCLHELQAPRMLGQKGRGTRGKTTELDKDSVGAWTGKHGKKMQKIHILLLKSRKTATNWFLQLTLSLINQCTLKIWDT